MEDYGFTQMEADTLYFPKKMTQVLTVIGDRLFTDLGIKSYHLAVLRVIYSNDGIDQKSIRSIIPFDKSRISVVVRELLDGGFVTDSASGRSSSLHLTDKGIEAVSRTPEFKKLVNQDIFGDFTEEEMQFLNDSFVRLNKRLNDILEKSQ